MTAHVIGLDVGTSGVRAAALTRDGAVVGTAATRFATEGLEPTTPASWWHAAQASLRRLARECDLSAVQALAIDGTSGTVVAVDASGDPVGPARMYSEPCGNADILARIAREAPPDSAALGSSSALARVLMMQDRPQVSRVLHQADWLLGRLTDRYDCSDENNALKTGYDPVARCWPDWVSRAGAHRHKLPDVYEPGAPVAPIGPAGLALGLPAALQVCAGTTDGCASFLATGAAAIGDAVTALGSTLVIKLLADKPISAPAYGIYSHRLGARWLVGGGSNTGGKVIETLFPRDRLADLTEQLRPEAPTGLHFYPLLAPGERFPINDPNLAPRLQPRPADEAAFFQAVLEGIAEVEALAYRRLHELGAPPLVSVRSVGGGADNAAWTKIRANMLKVPFAAAASQEACVGTARLVLERMVKA
ncbi:FGGY-family carbohydrate kinase [Methylovirgula sp. 4M-Z18]|uniref:FGGY-family carbohydrate kinase n=1 Tax=Methylovirgula sp. 4M-Z18 TaxID=2293567 RepID=UPI000E2FF0A6|nr:FGGY-family carbohydrate kinase [Methylovirgula sp. 4M-Z18]RFB79032.1 carbohydrate kinase [Methylovirgula sp. 4M-Z18]